MLFRSFDHREKLLKSFGYFLEEFKKLDISAEIWIDGSFATLAPDPSDIDVVFYFNPSDINALDAKRKELFERLFMTRKFIKNNYKVEVFYGLRGSELDYQQWQKTYGTCYDNITPKGIFRMYYN